jgi:plastocyanin
MKRVIFNGLAAALVAAATIASLPAKADGPKEHIVKVISNYDNLRMYFKPKMLIVNPGDTVTWVNLAEEDHNVLSYPDGFPKGAMSMKSPYLAKKGEKWSFTFTKKGSYQYHCIPHLPMGMHGNVVVSEFSKDEDFHIPTAKELAAYRDHLREYFDSDDFQYKSRDQRKQKAAAAK